MYTLNGKSAFVTGAGAGIGRGIALRLANEGADVVLFDLKKPGMDETARLIKETGRRTIIVQGDVSNYEHLESAMAQTLEKYGKLDILVNNAGISPMGTLVDTTNKTFDDVFRVNVNGVFYGCKLAGKHMMERKSGKIINIASWFGKIGRHSYGAYCSSKFAVIGLTQSLAMELAAYGVNVNAVCPGTIVETEMRDETDREAIRLGKLTAKQRENQIPLGRVGLPADIANVVAFLSSQQSDYMTGQSLNVTGGLLMH